MNDFTEKVIFTSHGMQVPTSRLADIPSGSTVRYFGPEHRLLMDPGLESVAEGVVDFVGEGHKGTTTKYFVGRFHNDNYDDVADIAQAYGVDIITTRNRRGPLGLKKKPFLTNQDLFNELNKLGHTYSEIHAIQCRGKFLKPWPRYWPTYTYHF